MPFPKPPEIRAARALLGWKQADLADKTGLSKMTIKFIEQGRGHKPRPNTMEKIETAFRSAGIEFGWRTITYR